MHIFSEVQKLVVCYRQFRKEVSRVYWAYHSITGGSFINYTLKSTRGVSRVPSDNRERMDPESTTALILTRVGRE